MLSIDRSASNVDLRAVDFLDAQQVKRYTGADDVADRIDRAHFMEVNLLDRYSMGPGFCFA